MRRATRGVLGALVAGALAAAVMPAAHGAAIPHLSSQPPVPSSVASTGFSATDAESSGESLYHAVTTPVAFSDVRFVLPGQGRMFVADADVVHVVNDQGTVERTFTGLDGAEGMVLSVDGTTLYVAKSSAGAIAAVNVATGEVTGTYTVSSCPRQLALIGATLFYTSGCLASGWIGHVDLTTGAASGTPDQVLDHSDALLTATSNTLIAADGHLRSWGVTSGPDGSPVFSTESNGSYFPHVLRLTPHNDDVVVIDSGVNAYGIYGPDLGPIRSYPTVAYPTAIAWSGDGTVIAGGSDTPDGNGIRLFSALDGSVISAASIPSLAGRDGNQGVVPGGLMFSADESTVIALTREWSAKGWTYAIARASTLPVPSSTVTLRVTPPTIYGRPSRIEVRSTGRPNSRILVTASARSWHASTYVTTDANCVGTTQLVVPYSGVLTASLAGDLLHEAAPPVSVRVRIPSALTVTMASPSRLIRGVVHYSKLSYMRQRVLLSPKVQSRMVRVTLQYRSGRAWVSTRPFTLYTDANGYVSTAMKSGRTGVLYRIAYSFSGDSWNTASSKVSPIFVLG